MRLVAHSYIARHQRTGWGNGDSRSDQNRLTDPANRRIVAGKRADASSGVEAEAFSAVSSMAMPGAPFSN